MISNLNLAMHYITLTVISLLLSVEGAFANRDLPREMINGLDQALPSNFNAIFEIKDKSSNEYVVASHRLTMDLVHIAENAKKNGNLLQSFRILRLTNYLFPHRGDIATKYDSILQESTTYLNTNAPCNETYEIFLRELKKSAPKYYPKIKIDKCPDINESVAEIAPNIQSAKENKTLEAELKSFTIQERVSEMALKKELTVEDMNFLHKSLLSAYLGSIELVSNNIDERESELLVGFELIRKNSTLTYKGFKAAWENITGKTFKEREILFNKPLHFTIQFYQRDKVTEYPMTILVDNLSLFDVWLNTINFFNYSNYPTGQISYQNDSYAFAFKAKTINMKFAQSNQLYLLYNYIEFTKVPQQVLKNLKKVVIRLD